MVSKELTTLLRSMIVLAGAIGFCLGTGLSLWKDVPLATALFRGALLCVINAIVIRILMMNLFRAYVHQLRLRKQSVIAARNKANEEKKK